MGTRTPPSDTRRLIMEFIKRRGEVTAVELASHLDITPEGARQQLQLLKNQGWIAPTERRSAEGAGRPMTRYQITPSGEHIFPKNYDGLSLTLVDAVADQFGPEALTQLLAAITEQQVRQWEPKLAGKTFAERIKALKGIYFEEDPHTMVRKDGKGYVLIEHNCPFLSVALRRPQLCSVTLSTLTRLLGVRVVREARFQDGDHRCVFRVLEHEPVDTGSFKFELENSELNFAG